jgi:hypothetical protein
VDKSLDTAGLWKGATRTLNRGADNLIKGPWSKCDFATAEQQVCDG